MSEMHASMMNVSHDEFGDQATVHPPLVSQSAAAPSCVRFSIVTPTLNAAAYLRECLDSVQSQQGNGVEVEHLILDGGSTDETKSILAGYPVRLLPRRPEDGLTAAMCMGYGAAQGNFVSFLGADDLLMPGALRAVAELWKKEQRPIVVGRSRWCTADLQSLGELAPPPRWLTAPIHACLGWNYLGAANCFIDPYLYRTLGGFDPTFVRAEDYEFYTRVLSQKIAFSRLPQTVCIYRRHGANESVQGKWKAKSQHALIRQRYGPRSSWTQPMLSLAMKSWVYSRNLAWAYHQIRGKISLMPTAWRGGRPGE